MTYEEFKAIADEQSNYTTTNYSRDEIDFYGEQFYELTIEYPEYYQRYLEEITQ